MGSRRTASQRYHDRVAGRYEQIYDDAWWQWHDTITWDYLKPHLPRELRCEVVDLGCGSGKWGRRLLKSGYTVTFVDLSVKMVEQARQLVEAEGLGERASFLQADLMDLSVLPENHFALATAMGEPIGLAGDPGRALREIARILSPGGIVVGTVDNRIACVDYYLEQGKPEEMERFLRSGRTHWLTRESSERFEIHTFTPGQLDRRITGAGLERIELIGKTVLPLRQHRDRLEDAAERRRWAAIEKRLARDPDNLARCAHLQFAARKPGA
jgi:ubiquinone/menaquinone biosynthesis C-methylase UbiE